MKFKSILCDTLSLLAGMILPLAFAPFHLPFIAVLSPALLYGCSLDLTPRRALWRWLLYGIGYFGVGVSWVYVSVHTYGNTPIPIAVFITSLFVLISAVFPMMNGYILTRGWPTLSAKKLCLAFPASWALLEYVRSTIFTGFPWLLLGYSQVESPLRGYIPIVGEFGVSFLIVLCSGCLVGAWHYRGKKIFPWLLVIALVYSTGWGLSRYHWTTAQGKPFSVSLVQGNIPQELKWDPNYLHDTLTSYMSLTRAHWSSRLIIWPEAAIPLPLQQAHTFVSQLDREVKHHHTDLLTGIPIQADDGIHYYNAVIALGQRTGTYYKRHLVPFGEYLPFNSLLRGIIGFFELPMSDFIPGPFQQKNIIAANIPIATSICYEIAYGEIVRSDLPQAQLLVTVTNNAWFGDSLAPWQYLQMSQFRALQTGRYFLSSSNNGISAIINPEGHIEKTVPQFCACVLTGYVTAMIGSTPWIDWGTGPIIMLLILALVLSGIPAFARPLKH